MHGNQNAGCKSTFASISFSLIYQKKKLHRKKLRAFDLRLDSLPIVSQLQSTVWSYLREIVRFECLTLIGGVASLYSRSFYMLKENPHNPHTHTGYQRANRAERVSRCCCRQKCLLFSVGAKDRAIKAASK